MPRPRVSAARSRCPPSCLNDRTTHRRDPRETPFFGPTYGAASARLTPPGAPTQAPPSDVICQTKGLDQARRTVGFSVRLAGSSALLIRRTAGLLEELGDDPGGVAVEAAGHAVHLPVLRTERNAGETGRAD